MTTTEALSELAHHGDRDLVTGLVDLAVNVRAGAPPRWLRERIAAADLSSYPVQDEALAAVGARHQHPVDEVLLTAGAAEAFVLVARAFAPSRAVVVHPQFTEPELALRQAGHRVDRVILEPPFVLDPDRIPADADLVVIGNPTNPTSVSHPAALLAELARPGRLLVVDEAFADCRPGEPQSLARRRDLPGLVVIRSLTKTWGLAGLRAGYLVAEPAIVARLARAQPQWPVSAPALAACLHCCSVPAVAEATAAAVRLEQERSVLTELLGGVDVEVVPRASASFVLIRSGRADLREALHSVGFAVRRGETFPGLDRFWIRVAVREPRTSQAFVAALREVLT